MLIGPSSLPGPEMSSMHRWRKAGQRLFIKFNEPRRKEVRMLTMLVIKKNPGNPRFSASTEECCLAEMWSAYFDSPHCKPRRQRRWDCWTTVANAHGGWIWKSFRRWGGGREEGFTCCTHAALKRRRLSCDGFGSGGVVLFGWFLAMIGYGVSDYRWGFSIMIGFSHVPFIRRTFEICLIPLEPKTYQRYQPQDLGTAQIR